MMRSGLAAAALSLTLGPGLVPPSIVADVPVPELPEISAKAWLLYDADAGVTVAEFNAHEPRPMASVTKIMTSLVVVENAALDETVRVSARAEAVGEAEIGLFVGELWTVGDLLAAVMVRSGNDAAMALAEHVGGTVEGFADMMNAKAESLGLENTRFVNPHGLDADGHFTTATDLRIMAEAAMQHPYLSRMMRTLEVEFRPNPQGVSRVARTTNRLLGVYPGIIGVKTGFTNKAGRVLVSALDHNGRTLIAVVMGSADHFADSRELLDYGARVLTVRDRFLAPLLVEEGGGGTAGGTVPSPLSDRENLRLQRVEPLPDGQWATTSFRTSELRAKIEALLRAVTPATLGGGP
jgi:D-alanyl-D-alanine carboxypeptidase (penicillin-binding protein 5/6)